MRATISLLHDGFHDLRMAARRLTAQPLVSVAIIFTFGVSVALATTIYSVAHSVLLRPLPYSNPDRLLSIWRTTPDLDFIPLPIPELFDLRSRTRSLDGVAGFAPTGFGARLADETVWVDAFEVTANWFSVLGMRPILGRTFQDGEDTRGHERGVVITETFWRAQLGADPHIIGTRLSLIATGSSATPFEVIGVVPDNVEFSYPTKLRPAAYVVRVFAPADVADPARRMPALITIARVRPEIELHSAAEEVRTLLSESVRRHPTTSIPTAAVRAVSLHEEMVGRTRPVVLLLAAAAVALLAIAATNVGAVTLAMAFARRREIAVRMALGCSMTRLVRALLVEHLLVALASGATAIIITAWMIPLIRGIAPVLLPRVDEIRLTGQTLWFATAVSLVGSLIFVVDPALGLLRHVSIARLTLRNEMAVQGRRQRLATMTTIVAQAALVIALLASAATIGRGLWRLMQLDLGFDPKHVLVAELTFPGNTRSQALEDQAIDLVRAVPGVVAVSTASDLPFSFGVLSPVATPTGDGPARAVVTKVTGDYFGLMRMSITRGRPLAASDAGNRALVVVNESLARALGIKGMVGERIKVGGEWREVIGTVRDVIEVGGVRADVIRQPGFTRLILPAAYIPRDSITPARRTFVLARTSLPPEGLDLAVQRVLHSVGPALVIRRISSLEQRVATPGMDARFAAAVIGGYALVGLLIASLGLYGLLTHVVRQRTREIAVRMALGATGRDILRAVVGGTVASVVTGLALGLGATAAAGRFLRPWLFETSVADAPAMIGTASVLLVVAIIAALSPALHLSRVSPTEALRAE